MTTLFLIGAATSAPTSQVANAVRSGLAMDLKHDWWIFLLALIVIATEKLGLLKKGRRRRRTARQSPNRRVARPLVARQPVHPEPRGAASTPGHSIPFFTSPAPESSLPTLTPVLAPIGTAGQSAQQVFERWSRNGADSQAVRAWAVGAEGERIVAGILDPLVREDLRVINDLQIPDYGGNIDHIVVGPRGVFVIDTKHYTDARVQAQPRDGQMRLFVNGRDRTRLVEQLGNQAEAVRAALRHASFGKSVPIFPVLCFVGGQGTSWSPFEIIGAHVSPATLLAEYVQQPGPCDVYWVQKYIDAILFGLNVPRGGPWITGG
jgi:hypothetical protein